MKAIIFNGGLGTRLHAITKSKIPKGHIPINGRPLISYQIENLLSVGIKKILIAYKYEEHMKQFQGFIKRKRVKRLNYEFSLDPPETLDHEKPHPFLNFRSKKTLDFIENSKFIAVNGDNIFKQHLLRKLIEVNKATSRSVIAKYETKRRQPFILESIKGQVYKLDRVQSSPSFYWKYDVCGTSLFSSKDLHLVKTLNKTRFPHITIFIEEALKKAVPIELIDIDFFINMNEYEDYIEAVKFIINQSFVPSELTYGREKSKSLF